MKAYLAFYSTGFKPEGSVAREAWARQREQRISRAGHLRIEIQDLVVSSADPATAVASFRQVFSSGNYSEASEKKLEWLREDDQWRIVRETARVLPGWR